MIISLLMPSLGYGTGNPSEKYHTFYGDVIAVDPHSITIKSGGKPMVFQITPQTKVSSRYGHVNLDQMKPGGGATVMMKLGQGNVGIAVRIRFDPAFTNKSNSLKLYAAKTIDGQVVSGMAIHNYVAYKPAAEGWTGGHTMEHDNSQVGVFLLEVNRDGTVAMVKMIKSTGYEELNLRAINWFKKWRFKPNTVTEVQLPISARQSRHRI